MHPHSLTVAGAAGALRSIEPRTPFPFHPGVWTTPGAPVVAVRYNSSRGHRTVPNSNSILLAFRIHDDVTLRIGALSQHGGNVILGQPVTAGDFSQ